jgi:hypothetical protein
MAKKAHLQTQVSPFIVFLEEMGVRTLMVRGGGFEEVVGLPTSPQQGGAKVSTEKCTLRYEIGQKKTTMRIQ